MSPKRRKTLLEDLAGIAGDSARRAFQELQDQAYSWSTEQARQRSGSGVATLYATLGLLPGAEPEVVEAAYRALAKKYHPDGSNPDSPRMTRIIAAHGEIKKLKGKA